MVANGALRQRGGDGVSMLAVSALRGAVVFLGPGG